VCVRGIDFWLFFFCVSTFFFSLFFSSVFYFFLLGVVEGVGWGVRLSFFFRYLFLISSPDFSFNFIL